MSFSDLKRTLPTLVVITIACVVLGAGLLGFLHDHASSLNAKTYELLLMVIPAVLMLLGSFLTMFFANINKRPVSMEVAREALKDIIPVQKKPSVTAELIKEAVAEYYDVPLSSILSQRRDKEVVVPRQVAMYLCHNMLSLPYKKTADIFGRSDHTTVINACKKINERLEQDEAFRRTLEDIQSRLT